MFYWDDHTGLINFLYFTLFITQASDFINSCYNKSKYPIFTNIRYRVFIFIMAKMPNNIRYRVFYFYYDQKLLPQVPMYRHSLSKLHFILWIFFFNQDPICTQLKDELIFALRCWGSSSKPADHVIRASKSDLSRTGVSLPSLNHEYANAIRDIHAWPTQHFLLLLGVL